MRKKGYKKLIAVCGILGVFSMGNAFTYETAVARETVNETILETGEQNAVEEKGSIILYGEMHASTVKENLW